MPLIIYPAAGADSFITVADATNTIKKYTLDGNKWDAKTLEEQEILLRIAFTDIINHTDSSSYPDPLPACVPDAQALMAVHDLVNSISGGAVGTQAQVKKQKAGPVEREFFELKTLPKSTTRVPEQAKSCLSSIGYVFPSFGQTLLGRS